MSPVRSHGHSVLGLSHRGSRTYRTWTGMKSRCLNPTSWDYYLYGAKGITVCERWLSFENFLEDMGERPVGRSIDRIDYTKGYEPANCRWATPSEQNKNKSKRIPLVFCKRGHRFSEDSTMHLTNGKRRCRTCYDNYQRAYIKPAPTTPRSWTRATRR